MERTDTQFYCPFGNEWHQLHPAWMPGQAYCDHAWWCPKHQTVSLKGERCGCHPLLAYVLDAQDRLTRWRQYNPDVTLEMLLEGDEYQDVLEDLAWSSNAEVIDETTLRCIVAYDWSLARRGDGLEDRWEQIRVNCCRYIVSALLDLLYKEFDVSRTAFPRESLSVDGVTSPYPLKEET